MKEELVKLGVVGLGRGKAVAGEIVGEKGVQVAAICDHNPEKLKKGEEYFASLGAKDVQSFLDFDEMLKSDINAVYIATDAIYHVPFVEKAMNAGKHVISEIPVVDSMEEAIQLKSIVKAHPELKYMAAENCCYWAFIQAWKEMYDNGKFGDIIYAESEYVHAKDYREYRAEDFPPDHWRTFHCAIKYLTHNLGPLLYIMGDKCVSVTCMEPDVKYNPYKNCAENGIALFKTAKGAVIRIWICNGAFLKFDHNFRLIGTRGTIETDNVKPLEEAHSFARFSDVPGSISEKIDIPVTLRFPGEADGIHGGADRKMMMAFVDCILNDTKPPIDVDLGIQMTLPGVLAHESALNGGMPMEIPNIE